MKKLGVEIPLGMRISLFGYGFKVEGTDGDGTKTTKYCVIGRNEARGSIKHNPNHVEAAARISAQLRFNSWSEVKATRTNVINAWLRSQR